MASLRPRPTGPYRGYLRSLGPAIRGALAGRRNGARDQNRPKPGKPAARGRGLADQSEIASPALLEALLRVTGSAPESARSLAGSISEWVGSAPVTRPRNVLLAEYRAAGLDHGPPAEPLESLSELGRVRGMTPDILAAIAPSHALWATLTER